MAKVNDYVPCNDSRECFARDNGLCMVLNSTYEKDGACPFCKTMDEYLRGRGEDVGQMDEKAS